ncbi:MAG: hypothetical protein ACOCRX_05120 [Candidatus Woesearchaeota archaeon]
MKKIYISHGKNDLDKEKFVNIKNRPGFTKPNGGLWACEIRNPIDEADFCSSWEEFCVSEDFDTERLSDFILFSLREDVKIYTIDNKKDLEFLLSKYGDLSFGEMSSPDFEAISQDYDGVFLSEEGAALLKWDLYGWSVSSLLLFNMDCIEFCDSLEKEEPLKTEKTGLPLLVKLMGEEAHCDDDGNFYIGSHLIGTRVSESPFSQKEINLFDIFVKTFNICATFSVMLLIIVMAVSTMV